MTPHEILQRQRYLKNENRQYEPDVFVEVPRHKWPAFPQTIPVTRCLRSRDFLVMIYQGTDITRLSIVRTQLNNVGEFRDGITWDEMQSIKDGCGFSHCDAVEAYPRKDDIVNVANVRHLWIVSPEYAGFFWRKNVDNRPRTGRLAQEFLCPTNP